MAKKVSVALFVLFAAALVVFLAVPREPGITKDLVYGNADGVDLKLDLAKPRSGTGPFPAVLCIHGGAWQAGSKGDFDFLIRNRPQ